MTGREALKLRDGEFIVCNKESIWFTKGKSYMVHNCSAGAYVRDDNGQRRWVYLWNNHFLKPNDFKDIEELFEI